jgi:hypothetical protein
MVNVYRRIIVMRLFSLSVFAGYKNSVQIRYAYFSALILIPRVNELRKKSTLSTMLDDF